MFAYLRSKTRKLKRRFWLATNLIHKRQVSINYQPVPGRKSAKAERLVEYCLGDFSHQPVPTCSRQRRYLRQRSTLLLETSADVATTSASRGRVNRDTKKIVSALISQRAKIPSNLRVWLIRGDGAGAHSDPAQGVHLTGMRSTSRRDLVLAPTGCRNRLLGPALKQQMTELKQLWIPWDQKSNTAWWGGALTGDCWNNSSSAVLTRRNLLEYFTQQPSEKVSCHLTELPMKAQPVPGLKPQASFSKQSAFSHKCLLLLPGNDIASGSSWYFCGNSVVLMPEPTLEHILHFEMEAWEHYIPLDPDPADVLVKLQWVIENPIKAQKIVANSHERLRWLCGEEYLWACNEVLRRIAESQTEQSPENSGQQAN